MPRRFRHKKNRVGAGVALLGAAAVTCLLAGWNAGGTRSAVLSAAETIALRFPDSRYDVWDNVSSLPATAAELDDGQALFDPNPTLIPPAVPAVATVTVTRADAVQTANADAATIDAPKVEPPATQAAKETAPSSMKLASVSTKPAPTPKTRPGAVLNDAQISSIKTRLKLTPEQQDMWPDVEAALRDLSFEKKSEGSRRKIAYTGTIDPYSSEVQRLKSAAFPLIMSFSDEQKRELRIIAHVAGLEKLAAQF
jgi:hypothetical protein